MHPTSCLFHSVILTVCLQVPMGKMNNLSLELEELRKNTNKLIPIDTSVEDWIKEIEENVKINKQHRANRKETEENKEIKNVIVNSKFMKEIMKLKEFSEMRCSF